jgi:DNA-binding NarL/FixJ family response regulator
MDSESGRSSLGLSHTPALRVLVVEDFAAFRHFICLALGKRSDLQVIGESADGLEAVQKALELKPDLILMDIGLPSLNGIEAARQICELVPESKIIFLSLESSAEIVEEALGHGAQAYVVKANAERELLPAIDDAISQNQFLRQASDKFPPPTC